MDHLEATEEQAAAVLAGRWGISSSKVTAVRSGRVNQTFLAEREDGGKLVVQLLNPDFQASPALGENWDAVSRKLLEGGIPCPALLPDKEGRLLSEGPGWGEAWRVSTFVSGARPEQNARAARLAAKCLGSCHSALNAPRPADLLPLPSGDFTNQRLPKASDFEDFRTLYRRHPSLERIGKPLARGAEEAMRLPGSPSFQRVFLMKDLVIHLDPKRDNFLDDGGRYALIDWDTVSYGDPLLDLGELCRSFAASEGTPRFDSETMGQALAGYRETGLDLGDRHFSLLPAAVRGIAVNLARRYLADALLESHFVWDRENYPSLFEQNVSRAGFLLDLAEELREREFELMKLITG
ncbi:MAG: phosphotransferase [Deltaproteobacteria bacterium]|nr:phosphotransferase [Deltaproteobacteria bacterium]